MAAAELPRVDPGVTPVGSRWFCPGRGHTERIYRVVALRLHTIKVVVERAGGGKNARERGRHITLTPNHFRHYTRLD